MDVFSRTFLPAAAEAWVPIPTVSRHMPILRRCVEADDPTVLVTRCLRPDPSMTGDFLLVLTRRRLVVTHESLLLRRLRLHLNADLRHLSNVSWNPDPRRCTVDLVATAVDGIRERFGMRLPDPGRTGAVDALLKRAFHDPVATRTERQTVAAAREPRRLTAAVTAVTA